MSGENASNLYTEAQHFALLESALKRETAELSEAKGTLEAQVGTLTSEKAALADDLATAKSRIDVLEAEKAAAEAKAEAATKEFANFKADLAREREVAEKRALRVERVKAANTSLGEDYFTQERAQRWAEMPDEAFDALVADLIEAAAAKPGEQQTGGETEKSATQMARESAAFTGGQTATSTSSETTLARLLGVKRRGATA